MNLLEKLKQLPNDAGVYQYFNKDGHLLYVGKAKVLKNRVKSYFKFTPTLMPADKLGPRIYKMISEVASCDWIVVPNEHDALILENRRRSVSSAEPILLSSHRMPRMVPA